MRWQTVGSVLFLACFWYGALPAPCEDRLWTLEVQVDGQTLQGYPLAWDDQQVHLLSRDGRWCSFPMDRVEKFRKLSDRFRPYSVSEFRAELLRELGPGFEASTTAHYILVHPKGRADTWAERLEELYRAMVRYFSVRTFPLQEPRFPLVAVLCRDSAQWAALAGEEKRSSGEKLLGYYSLRTNRMYLYDWLQPLRTKAVSSDAAGQTAGDEPNRALVHEAFHQIAFNTGLHQRFSPPPVWVAEGLATMFEAPGVWQARSLPHRKDRVHPILLSQYRKRFAQSANPAWLESLITSDEMFKTTPADAYAGAWALTFFLVELYPQELATYLEKTVARPLFHPYPCDQRLQDFQAVFSDDLRMLLSRMNRFLEKLP